MDWHERTVDTYDRSAQQLAEYFKGIGSRTDDIERGLELAGVDPITARVIEIGCGDGRDAQEIAQRAGWYEGFDPSEKLLDLAREKVPEGSFVKADALSYEYPQNIDVAFAFASLLHVNEHDLSAVFQRLGQSLRFGGIVYLSLKEREAYEEEVQKDQYGERKFYYYNVPLVQSIAGTSFESVFEDHQQRGATGWLTLALKKINS